MKVPVVVGRVGRAHGIRGEVSVELRTDEPERRFAPGSILTAGANNLEVVGHRWHSGRLLVRFQTVTDRTAAEALRGAELVALVTQAERPEDEDEFYDRQLVGLRVLDHRGEEAGQVTAVLHLPTQDVLAIETPVGERLVPFVSALVPRVDLEAGVVQLAEVGGLLEDDDAS